MEKINNDTSQTRRHDGADYNLEDFKVTVPQEVKRIGEGKQSAPLLSSPQSGTETFQATHHPLYYL